MTVLSACQSAALRLSQTKPTSVFSSTASFDMEMAELSTETAIAIAKAHDWQKLTTLKTYSGDGSTTAFTLPSDYDRMIKDGNVHSSLYQTALFRRVEDLDEWLYLSDLLATPTPGNWIILGGEMQILPAMASNETARFYYISNNIATGSGGAQSSFMADADSFNLSERLLTLGLIWRWRAQKRLEYAEDMQNYEIALSEEISRDKGARILVVGNQRAPAGMQAAYPYPGTL
jgi:hypothetical protein